MTHIESYNPDTDERFQRTLDEKYVDLLDKHGFPVNDLQPKNVHDLGISLGEEYNYYIDQSKQLFIQSRLSLAVGIDLDNFGTQFSTPRRTGENDETYRLRLQAVFSPRKVTRPHIELVLNQISDVEPPPTLFEPWRFVMHFDILFPYDWTYDTGPWFMWSPDYWRSGILVVRSGLTSTLFGVVEALVNAGVVVLYEQTFIGSSDQPDFFPDHHSYQEDEVISSTRIFECFWFDIDQPGAMDTTHCSLDVGSFTLAPTYQEDEIVSQTYMTFGYCLRIPITTEAVWDDAEWDIAQWPFDDGLTEAHRAVLNNPWMEFDTVDPGAFLANQNDFQLDFNASSNFDDDPENSGLDNDTVIVFNDPNIMDTLINVITGWSPIDSCLDDQLFYIEEEQYYNTILELVNEVDPGNYLYIEIWEDIFGDAFLDLQDTVLDDVDTTYHIPEFENQLIFTDMIGIEYEETVSDTLTFTDDNSDTAEFVILQSDTLTFNDMLQEEEPTVLGDNALIGTVSLSDLPNDITLSNPTNITLENFEIE